MIYCPRCAAQNIEDAKFCRSCGTDISFVAPALTGNLPAPARRDKKSRGKKPATIAGATEDFFVGVAFLLIVLGGAIFFTGGFMIWIWMLIPGFACVGSGIGKYLQFRHEQQSQVGAAIRNVEPPSFLHRSERATEELPASDASMLPRGSVTDGTTRLFDNLDNVPRGRSAVRVEPSSERHPPRS
ncbi:MAG: zinc-ribbon domain-containing protein [Pyrinomonadaceae bacterium MAG19_C2-C3]|nr:zinc-ribbon domain-containing protein [Pyrinomonadaceae bacterium MAG19_C2-C3]